MKNVGKFVSGVIVGALCVAVLVFCSCVAHNYTINGYVNYVTDESVVLVDATGNEWEYLFDDKVDKTTFAEHEGVVIHFNDNCTDNERVDDVITDIEKR